MRSGKSRAVPARWESWKADSGREFWLSLLGASCGEERRSSAAVRRLMTEARSWLNKARNVSQSRTALKKMREVLHAGLRLGSEVPQVEELRQEIRRREWEEHAKRVRQLSELGNMRQQRGRGTDDAAIQCREESCCIDSAGCSAGPDEQADAVGACGGPGGRGGSGGTGNGARTGRTAAAAASSRLGPGGCQILWGARPPAPVLTGGQPPS